MGGRRAGIDPRVKKMMLEAGYVIVAIDYRLAPETKLPGIIEDLEDAFKWVQEKGPTLFRVITSRIAVIGDLGRRVPHAHLRVPRETSTDGACVFLGVWRSGGGLVTAGPAHIPVTTKSR